MGLRLAALAAAVARHAGRLPQAHQAPDGGFAEAGGSQGPLLTAWAALGLRGAGADTGKALDYLEAHEDGLAETTDVELVALAESALGARAEGCSRGFAPAQQADGRIGPNVNSTIWGILALRQARQRRHGRRCASSCASRPGAAAGPGTSTGSRIRTTPRPRSRRCARRA